MPPQQRKIPSRKKQTKTKTSKFRSGLEERIALALEDAGVEYEYESINIPYTVPAVYTPDFRLPNGILIEAKGYFRSEDRRKHLLIKEQYPDLDIRFVFTRVKSKVARAKMTCGQWCERHDFKYAEERIPDEWISETRKRKARNLDQFRKHRPRFKE